jgi:hypothetical protein
MLSGAYVSDSDCDVAFLWLRVWANG